MPLFSTRLRAAALAGALALLAAMPAGAVDRVVRDSSAALPARASAPPLPLLLDANDLGMGTTACFDRLIGPADVDRLGYFETLQHVVLALPAWPEGYAALAPLAQLTLPNGADIVVVLPGYPPTHAAAEAWNVLRRPVRIVMLVDGPPADRTEIIELNAIRGLERVIAQMPRPSRSGFERLARPLSFRVVMP